MIVSCSAFGKREYILIRLS